MYWNSFVKVQFATVFFLFRLMLHSGMQVAWGGESCHWEFNGCLVICSYQVIWSSDSNACHCDLLWKQSVRFAFCNRTRKIIFMFLCIYEVGSESTNNRFIVAVLGSEIGKEWWFYGEALVRNVWCAEHAIHFTSLSTKWCWSAVVEFFCRSGIFLVSSQDVSIRTTWQIPRWQCCHILRAHWISHYQTFTSSGSWNFSWRNDVSVAGTRWKTQR